MMVNISLIIYWIKEYLWLKVFLENYLIHETL